MDIFYPIGSYYETSNIFFDPNVAWCGTWVQDSKGLTTVAKADSGNFLTVGNKIGAETLSLSTSNLPAHTHTVSAHSHGLNSHTHTFSGTSHNHTFTGYATGSGGIHDHYIKLYSGPYSATGVSGIVAWGSSTGTYGATGPTTTYQLYHDTIEDSASHTHTTSGYNASITATGTVAAASGNTADSTSFSSGSAGSGTAISLVQPSIVVIRWHRTA